MTDIRKMASGAFFGTLLGSLVVALYPKRHEILDAVLDHSEGLSDKAKEYADFLVQKSRDLSGYPRPEPKTPYVAGGLISVLLCTGLALLAAPKSRKKIQKQVVRTYGDLFAKTKDVVKQLKEGTHPFQNPKKINTVSKKRKRVATKTKE